MIQRYASGITGLIAFLCMLVAGYLVGNDFSTIIWRGICALTLGCVLGYACGYIANILVNEHFTSLLQAEIARAADTEEEESENKSDKKLASSSESRQDKGYSESGRKITKPAVAAKAAAALFEELRVSNR